MTEPKAIHIKSIQQFHRLRGLPGPSHPLVSVVDYSQTTVTPEIDGAMMTSELYSIGLKRNVGTLRYGQQEYDFDDGVMSFLAPGQRISISANRKAGKEPSGYILIFHPDFLWNTSLHQSINSYDFWGYAVNEALFLSQEEESNLLAIMNQIEKEYRTNIDGFSQSIICSHIENLLNYAQRYYQRQFITRKKSGSLLVSRFESLLSNFLENKAAEKGLPTVSSLAEELHLSPDYLSSLLKNHTGKNTQEHIHFQLIQRAKEKLSDGYLSISEIAYSLGFEHPQSFSRLFKTRTSTTPQEFRTRIENSLN